MRKLTAIVALLIGLIATMPIVHAELLHLTYDANGNLISGDGKYRVYNDFNQLVEVYNGSNSTGNLLERYEWDPVQERILIKDVFETGSIKETIYYINKNFYQVENVSGLFNFTEVYQNGELVAENTPHGKEFVSSDPLGSSSLRTDSGGTPIENTTYDPYGNIIAGGSGRFDQEGKEFSSLTGDYDYNFRKYNPTLKLFTQPETTLTNIYDPQNLNRYTYEKNNPNKYDDPDGKNPLAILAIGAIGFTWGSLSWAWQNQGAVARGEMTDAQFLAHALGHGVIDGAGLAATAAVAVSGWGIPAIIITRNAIGLTSTALDNAIDGKGTSYGDIVGSLVSSNLPSFIGTNAAVQRLSAATFAYAVEQIGVQYAASSIANKYEPKFELLANDVAALIQQVDPFSPKSSSHGSSSSSSNTPPAPKITFNTSKGAISGGTIGTGSSAISMSSGFAKKLAKALKGG